MDATLIVDSKGGWTLLCQQPISPPYICNSVPNWSYLHGKENSCIPLFSLEKKFTPTVKNDCNIKYRYAVEHYKFIFSPVLQHSGNVGEAVRWLDEAQSLDTADRYINCKCAKFMLRADMVPEAEAMCTQFTRDGVAAADNLNEMQCMWYETEVAAAHQRLGAWGDALKKCHEVDKVRSCHPVYTIVSSVCRL